MYKFNLFLIFSIHTIIKNIVIYDIVESDILIYNVLKSSDDLFIKKCNLKFIDKSVPAQEDDTIYIATVDLETGMKCSRVVSTLH